MDLAKTCRMLDSVRGTDKVLMLVQYSSKLLTWYLKKLDQKSPLAARIANLAGPVADFRILLRYYGLLPLIRWIQECERNPDPNPKLRLLARLQNIVNLAYYPLEHAYWLGLHQVIPMTDKTRDKIGMWSCRFWAAYVVFYFAQLWEERRAMNEKERALRPAGQKGDSKAIQSLKEIESSKQQWNRYFLVNAAYFPLTVHWSLETSMFPDVGVGICGTIAAVTQLLMVYKAA